MGLLANTLTLGCDCLGEINYFDGPPTTTTASRHHPERDLHARGGRRNRLEAPRPAPARSRSAARGASSSRRSPPSGTMSTASSGTCTRTARSSSRSSSPACSPPARSPTARCPSTAPRSRRASTGRTTSTSSTCGWTWRSTAPQLRLRGRLARPSPRTGLNPYRNAWVTPGPTLVTSGVRRARAWNWDVPTRSWKITARQSQRAPGEKDRYKLEPRGVVKPFVQPGSYIYDRARFVQKPACG